jgi:septum site-determining protein MinC
VAAIAPGSFEPAGELKFGQVGLANLRILTLDVERLAAEMRERVERAPKLFARAAVLVDFGSLPRCPETGEARALLAALRGAGVCPVGLAFGTDAVEQLARELELPVLAKFRAQYERSGAVQAAPEPPPPAPEPVPAAAPPRQQPAATGLMQGQPVRSGQQVYAKGRDLIVTATVGAGAEVIADGSVHIYGALRGRALAGAQGDGGARIFCREFHAELVAIAGQYRVMEEIPKDLRGKPVQVWLDEDRLRIEEIA